MFNVLFALFAGYLLSLIGLNDLFQYLMGFSTQQYYLVWFIFGAIIWITNLLRRT